MFQFASSKSSGYSEVVPNTSQLIPFAPDLNTYNKVRRHLSKCLMKKNATLSIQAREGMAFPRDGKSHPLLTGKGTGKCSSCLLSQDQSATSVWPSIDNLAIGTQLPSKLFQMSWFCVLLTRAYCTLKVFKKYSESNHVEPLFLISYWAIFFWKRKQCKLPWHKTQVQRRNHGQKRFTFG